MTETQQRFLRVIAERVGAERVVELHLFPGIRQGGMESGVAVVAVRPPAPLADDTVDPVASPEGEGGTEAGGDVATADEAQLVDDAELDDSPYADSADEEVAVEVDALVVEASPGDGEDDAAAPAGPERLTVYSAHYRLTIKGPDRGKWDADVVAEADAPLDTVDAVVRGVQRRAGEVGEAERFTGDAFRAALESPVWTSRA
jgi:hypothetical protein